jgi:proteasome accessory factor B
VERLIDLVALLLETTRPLPFEQIRRVVPAYQQEDAASAKRMFERDKDVLREVGIPVEVSATDVWEVEQGYHIPKDRYYLPDVAFSEDEVWALFVAAHAPGASDEAELAFQKLSTGTESNVLSAMAQRAPAPGVDASGPHLGVIADALARRRAVKFRYRPAHGKAGQREVEPYSLVFRGGRWYLVGLDRARKAIRSFRLTRVSGPVKEGGPASGPPEGFDGSAHVEAGPWGIGQPASRATVLFSPKVAWWAVPSARGAKILKTRRDGWVEADVPAGQAEQFASWLLSFGPDAKVIAPKVLRDEVVSRLEAVTADG